MPRSFPGPRRLRAIADDPRLPPILVLVGTVLLVLTWASPAHEAWPFAGAFLATFAASALLQLRERSDDPRRWLAPVGVVAWASALVLVAGAGAVSGFWDRVWLEVAVTVLVAGSATVFAWLLHQVLDEAARPTFAGPAAMVVLFWAGAAARWFEMGTVLPQEDAQVLHLVLRHDVGQMLWTLGATVASLHTVYAFVAERLVRLTPALKRGVAVLAVLMTVVAHVGIAVATVGTVTARGRPEVGVGVHARDVGRVPDGLSSVHLEVWWGHVRPGPDRWDWERPDRQIGAAKERGLDVLLLVGLKPPEWVVDTFPNATMVDQDGHRFHKFDRAPGQAADRVHDLSYAHPEVNAMRERFVRAVVTRYGDVDAVDAVAVMNEPSYPGDFNLFRIGSYDDATVSAFRDRMRAGFANVSAMNAEMGTDFTGFEEVRPPESLDGPYGEAWQRFRGDTIVELVDRLVAAAREHTTKPVTVKIMAHYLTRFATPQTALTGRVVEELARMSDIVAVNVYPVSRADLEQTLAYYGSIAGDKPLWLTEFNFALGPNLPTTGTRTYETLALVGDHAERVFFYSADDHYLYGLSLYDSSPTLAAIQLYETPAMSGEFHARHAALLAAELGAVTNLYHVYATTSAFAGLPVVPWPVLALLAVPLPRPAKVRSSTLAAGRVLGAGAVWLAIWAPGAVGVG